MATASLGSARRRSISIMGRDMADMNVRGVVVPRGIVEDASQETIRRVPSAKVLVGVTISCHKIHRKPKQLWFSYLKITRNQTSSESELSEVMRVPEQIRSIMSDEWPPPPLRSHHDTSPLDSLALEYSLLFIAFK